MKKVFFVVLTIFGCIVGCGVGLISLLQVFYNLDGFIGLLDRADGPKWEALLGVVISLLLTLGSFYFTYRMIRRLAAIERVWMDTNT